MERQVALVLVALCALLGCACTCEFEERVSVIPEPLVLASALRRVGDSDPDACRARCCELKGCDAAVLALPQDGRAQCFLIDCGGACTLLENNSGQYRVFTRSDAHAPDNALHVMPLMLEPRTRTGNQNTSTNVTTDVCALPPLVGLCKAALPRFYFDSKTGSCRQFIYGGCGSNGNNFNSQQECETACPRVKAGTKGVSPQPKAARMAPPLQTDWSEDDSEESDEKPETKEMTQDEYSELCLAPLVVGPCRAAFPRWFYNASSGRCEKFIYGGCRGNKNNHLQEETCSSSCAEVKVLPSKKQDPEMSEEYKSQCVVAPDSGPCRAAFSMFYFDLETQSCKTFIYGGCRGNDNRYGSEQECTERCTQIESSEGHERTRSRWTAAFLLFLALATVSFLLLTALVVITVRRRRGPRRTLSIRSDKEELLPDSERSSMDSLPLPESPNKA